MIRATFLYLLALALGMNLERNRSVERSLNTCAPWRLELSQKDDYLRLSNRYKKG